MSNQKKSYTKPELNVHGNVEVLTQATDKGTKIDAAFPASTPLTDLTLS
ncbi:MAG: hypothetical protein WBA39_08355 [Rivularia sp. (in: cyanobacteria)]